MMDNSQCEDNYTASLYYLSPPRKNSTKVESRKVGATTSSLLGNGSSHLPNPSYNTWSDLTYIISPDP